MENDQTFVDTLINTQGFEVSGVYLIRECAIVHRKPWCRHLDVLRFSPDVELQNLPDSELRKIRYCETRVHGLRFYPSAAEVNDQRVIPQSSANAVISTLLAHGASSSSTRLVGYKGNDHERTLIESLGFTPVNLEDLGCPPVALGYYRCNPRLHGDCTRCAVNHVLRFLDFLFLYENRRVYIRR